MQRDDVGLRLDEHRVEDEVEHRVERERLRDRLGDLVER